MTDIALSEKSIHELGRASRRAAVLSVLGFLVVLGAMGYAVFQLSILERQRTSMQQQLQHLTIETRRYESELSKARSDLAKVRSDLATSRASLAAARAAITAFHAGRLTDAVSLYDEALAADPSNAYLQNLRAYALFRLGRIDAAIEGQHRSLKAEPNYAWGYFDLARFLCSTSPPRFEEAKHAVARAIELRPDMRSIIQTDGEFQRVCRHRIP